MKDVEKHVSTYEDQRYCPNCGQPIVAEILEPQGVYVDDRNGYCVFRDCVYIHSDEDLKQKTTEVDDE